MASKKRAVTKKKAAKAKTRSQRARFKKAAPRESMVSASLFEASSTYHSGLLIPKASFLGDPDAERPAAVRARAAYAGTEKRSGRPTLAPSKAAAPALAKVGLSDLEELRQNQTSSPGKGMFAELASMGATAVVFDNDGEEDNVLTELGEDYEFVPDFKLGMPPRVSLDGHGPAMGRSALSHPQWPEASGVGKAHEQGIRGGGVLVAVLDTGVDADHAEFQGKTITYRYVSLHPRSWPARDIRGFDTDGHGTHVSGIIAGETVGVAPDVELYAASVIESETTLTSMTRVAYGLDWVMRQFSRPDNEHKPAILNMSLGFPPTPPQGTSDAAYRQRLTLMRSLLQRLYEANVVPFTAIGNSGAGEYGYPGGFADVLGVGAVDYDGKIASFSGSGNPPDEGVSKPDLVGYGVDVYSSVERDYEGNPVYKRFNGTSMATPYVSGIASLYRCRHPQRSADEIWNMLLENAQPTTPVARTGQGIARFL